MNNLDNDYGDKNSQGDEELLDHLLSVPMLKTANHAVYEQQYIKEHYGIDNLVVLRHSMRTLHTEDFFIFQVKLPVVVMHDWFMN